MRKQIKKKADLETAVGKKLAARIAGIRNEQQQPQLWKRYPSTISFLEIKPAFYLNDGGTHVPLIANWTGTVKPGQVVDDLVDFSDFFATFTELAGGSLPKNVALDSRSFASRLLKNQPAPRTWAFSEGRGAN